MRRHLLFLVMLAIVMVAATKPAFGQDDNTITKPSVWTLQQCIDWAKAQNIDIRQKRLSVKEQELVLDDARKSRLPDIGFSSSQNVGFRPFRESSAIVSGDQITTSSSKFSYNGSYGLNASMPLYDGGKIKNNTRLAEIDTQIAQLQLEKSELSIEESITQLYVQILYCIETIKQDNEQIKLSQAQVDRAHEVYNAGLMSHVQVVQLETQLASDQYQLVADETQLANYKLQLKQLLELDGDETLEIVVPLLDEDVLAPVPAKLDVYYAALMLRPEIKAQQLAMDRSDVNIELAKASMRPTINANAGISTSNMTSNGNFFEQLYRQWNNSIGVSLNIPLYDHGKTKNAVARARIQKESAQLDLTNNQKALWKTIENYWLEANSAQQRYIAAKEKVRYARESVDLTSEQFRLGIKNIIELQNDLTNLSQANQQMLQAKYMEILNVAMLKYYQGETINI